MGTSRKITENQLQEAKQAVQLRATTLKDSGTAVKDLKRDPLWRKLDAKARQVATRLKRIGATEALNAEVAERKVTSLAAKVAKKAERAQPKPKAAPAAPAAKKEEKPKAKGKKKPAE
jgi:uncharacterized membrane protein